MYSLDDFGAMISDSARFKAYAEAISRCVRPGNVVLEIGCGPAVFSLLACHAGAKRVYAIETEDIIDVWHDSFPLFLVSAHKGHRSAISPAN